MKKLFGILLFLLPVLVYSQEGKVIKVKDGDTVVILDNTHRQHTIRVADIDCPEYGQPFSEKARQFTSGEVYGKTVQVKEKNKDRYGRTVGYIWYDGNKNLSLELLKAGLAWHYKYYSNDAEMDRLEAEARRNRVGLWADQNPVNPYEWRKGKRTEKVTN